MPTTIETTKAVEKSTFLITATFRDEEGELVTPDSMTWTLTNYDGTVINEREDVEISPLGSSVDILLEGDDLAIMTGAPEEERYLLLEGTYTSQKGAGLPFTDQLRFFVTNLRAIS